MKKKEQVKANVPMSSNEPQIAKEEETSVEEHLYEFSWDGLKDEDIVGLITYIVSEYNKATLKARYELLKEYKQGLLVDADVAEEIDLYEESLAEAKASSSTYHTNVEPPIAMADVINVVACNPSIADGTGNEPQNLRRLLSNKFCCFLIFGLNAKFFFLNSGRHALVIQTLGFEP
ncbi:hypothetical protein TIFTF001_015405 [Ficus carica]|uniref:Uncharacterized protein n=1 Tax=Ficus carica TaxID=3494 RepID=A0AA88A4F1_FICCA|nr:hypothetical protein TIFTF001_015405 [Ficus carica]